VKSKRWLISLGLAVALVVAFAIPACTGEPTEYWYTPEGEKISFDIATIGGRPNDISLMVVEDLRDFGLDVQQQVLDSGTFYQYLYEPNLGGMEAFVISEGPSPDPWSDWIWMMLSDPENWGYLWNPTWYNDDRYNELFIANFVAAPNLSVKREILLEMQEILAEDSPVVFLVRDDFIAVHRTDNWGNWFNELGGYVSWINEHSIREVTQLGDETQLRLGALTSMDSLVMDQNAMTYTTIGCLYLKLVYESLLFYAKVDEDLGAAYDFVPKLATGYEISHEDDGTGGQNQVWTIDLREGVKWHDYDTSGKNLSADDAVYSMKYVWDRWGVDRPINWTAVEANDWEIEPEHVLVTKTGDYQIQWRFIEGWHQNEDYFVQCSFSYDRGIVPKHIFDAEGAPEDPMSWTGNYTGTGAYKVKEFVADDYLLLERNDDYWGPLPEAEQVLFKVYAGSGPLFLALEVGDIDCTVAEAAQPAKVDEYVANPDLEVDVVKDLAIYYLGFNLHPDMGYEPLQDVVLRQAIAQAIDKQAIIDVAMGGYGEKADSWVYNESPNHHPDLPNNDYDPTLAASILTTAGYTKHA